MYKLFQINLEGLVDTEITLVKDPFCCQPSELEKMPYWQYELFLEKLNKRIKEENKQQEEQKKQYGDMNPSSMMRQAQRSVPKMPAGPKMPKF